MNLVLKYLAFIFLLNNILFGIIGYYQIANIMFLAIMTFTFICSIYSLKILKDVVFNKSFQLFFLLNLLNIIYYLFLEFGDLESFKYLLARFIQFSIFSISVYLLKENFVSTLLFFLKYITIGCLILSIVFNFPDFTSRYQGIFQNPNEFSILMVIGFAYILLVEKRNIYNYILLILFLFGIVLSGSRSAMLGVFLSVIVYLFHHKSNNLINTILILSSLLIFYLFGGQNNAVQRIFEFDLINRKYEYLYAIETFLQKPIFGYGLKNYTHIDFSLIQFDDVKIDFGAHNAYLSILVQYGAFFSLIFFSIFIYYLVKIYKTKLDIFNENILKVKYLLFLVSYTLINGLFENTIIGINFFQTNLFWLIICYFTCVIYQKNESRSISN